MTRQRRTHRRLWLDQPCLLRLRDKTYGARLVEASLEGCRITTDATELRLGTTVDISFEMSGSPALITGVPFNKRDQSYGISILAIGWNTHAQIASRIAGRTSSPGGAAPGTGPSMPIRRALVLGAGGGKILAQLRQLSALEEMLGRPLQEYFDILCGASSGALLLSLIAAGRTTEEIRTSVLEQVQALPFSGIFTLHRLLDRSRIHSFLESMLGPRSLGNLARPFLTVSRRFGGALHRTYCSWNEPDLVASAVIRKAIAVPVLLGVEEGEMDGATGLFVNPAELLFRELRGRDLLQRGLVAIYLDAGFDPVAAPANSFLADNIVSQLLWAIGAMQRDLNLAANDRIAAEFPGVFYAPHFFSFSETYDLTRPSDLLGAEREAIAQLDTFRAWLANQPLP